MKSKTKNKIAKMLSIRYKRKANIERLRWEIGVSIAKHLKHLFEEDEEDSKALSLLIKNNSFEKKENLEYNWFIQ